MSTPLFSKQLNITIDGSILACATDYSLSITKDMIEVACMNSSTRSKLNVPDLYSYTISGSGMVFRTSDVGSNYGFSSIVDSVINGDASIGWSIVPDVSAQDYLSGVGYFSSASQEGGVGSAVTYSYEITGTGDIAMNTTT